MKGRAPLDKEEYLKHKASNPALYDKDIAVLMGTWPSALHRAKQNWELTPEQRQVRRLVTRAKEKIKKEINSVIELPDIKTLIEQEKEPKEAKIIGNDLLQEIQISAVKTKLSTYETMRNINNFINQLIAEKKFNSQDVYNLAVTLKALKD